uniref:Uncharacterized protein n=1 Tax=Ixodes ricinus TaxID=34613 RepID=A0A0K8RG23_IXORI
MCTGQTSSRSPFQTLLSLHEVISPTGTTKDDFSRKVVTQPFNKRRRGKESQSAPLHHIIMNYFCPLLAYQVLTGPRKKSPCTKKE